MCNCDSPWLFCRAVITNKEGAGRQCWRTGESWRSAGETDLGRSREARAIASAHADNRRIHLREIAMSQTAKFLLAGLKLGLSIYKSCYLCTQVLGYSSSS